MSTVLTAAVMTAGGLAGARLVRPFKLPAVTGYLLAGIIIGPSVLGIIPQAAISSLSFIETLALGFIAFGIGKEFERGVFAKVGPGVVLLTVVQGLTAAFFVTVGLRALGFPLPLSLILGGIATATAPAATALVIKEYNADGPLTRTLLQVVALDDALGIIVFGLLTSAAKVSIAGSSFSMESAIVRPVAGIAGALLSGTFLGLVLAVVVTRISSSQNAKTWAIAAVLTAIGMADMHDWSPLLVNMALGASFVNSTGIAHRVSTEVDEVVSPLYVPFFVLAGASLSLETVGHIGLLGLSYLMLRSAGKIAGAWIGARWSSMPATVQRYLGLALLPQAGVSIGMVAVVRKALPQLDEAVTTVILGSVMVYEVLGPVLARVAIFKSGEAGGLECRTRRD